jgi:hypothetical protein
MGVGAGSGTATAAPRASALARRPRRADLGTLGLDDTPAPEQDHRGRSTEHTSGPRNALASHTQGEDAWHDPQRKRRAVVIF